MLGHDRTDDANAKSCHTAYSNIEDNIRAVLANPISYDYRAKSNGDVFEFTPYRLYLSLLTMTWSKTWTSLTLYLFMCCQLYCTEK